MFKLGTRFNLVLVRDRSEPADFDVALERLERTGKISVDIERCIEAGRFHARCEVIQYCESNENACIRVRLVGDEFNGANVWVSPDELFPINAMHYEYINAWGYLLSSDRYYIQAQQKIALRDNAPCDAIYFSKDKNRWCTLRDVDSIQRRHQLIRRVTV